ncbi:uncharacterized protein LOC106059934 [Biomphalaria glabrata]|uniref:Uncharacterized protein LOC106059934 n=1 Tax=Biomphalaria glabrata TaxID=6526 RepID=A0A9W2YP66_BIOGL|nr:uncharacterized protein LOC106059934 [Biomphalaria glabrata]
MGIVTCLPLVLAWTCCISVTESRASQVFSVSTDAIKAYLDLMNAERKLYGLVPLGWNNVLRNRANTYGLICDNHRGYGAPADKYGQLLFKTSNKYTPQNGDLARMAVAEWLKEKSRLDPPAYRCTTRSILQCAQYAQIVNKDARHVGCGEMQCFRRVVVCGFDHPLSGTETKKPGT